MPDAREFGLEGFGCDAHEVPSNPAHAEATGIDIPSGVAVSRVASVPVRHGMMPSVAYRIERDGRSIAYSGDVAEGSDALIALAQDCDVLIHDAALPEREVPHGELHAKPSQSARWLPGRVAARSFSRTSCPNSKTNSMMRYV